MDRLISLEPTNVVAIRIEPGQRCYGVLTLRNVMYTMPVAFRLQPVNKIRYTVRPQSGIISPLNTIVVEITYHISPNSSLPDSFLHCDDSFLLHSIVVPGAAVKDPSSMFDSVPNDWFTTRKKQVFIDSGLKIMFVGSPVLAHLVVNGLLDQTREVLERSDQEWKAADSIDSEGETLLHLAIAQGRSDFVQILLEFEPNVELQNRSGTTPLEAAAASGEALIVELLLARCANTERSETSTWGPIHLAARGGHMDVLRLLLLKGADVNSRTRDGNSALHIAVGERRRDCARLLVANGARADACNGGEGETPLHIASGLGDGHMVKLLLQKGANKDIRNKHGKTAYNIAAEHGHTRLFDELCLGDRLCVAARKGEVRTIQRLLESGAAINGSDQNRWTALHRASLKGRLDAVLFLIDKGGDVNARDEDGYTPLHCAVESGHADVIELLVKKGADVEARTNKGVTALRIAESLNYSGIRRILIHGGATKDGVILDKSAKVEYGRDSGDLSLIGANKKKSTRGRTFRNTFDRSMPLAVL